MCRIFVLILLLSMPLASYAQKEEVLVQDSIYSVVEQMPSFPGGDFEMMKYIGKHLYFADSILYLGVQGRVVIWQVSQSLSTISISATFKVELKRAKPS